MKGVLWSKGETYHDIAAGTAVCDYVFVGVTVDDIGSRLVVGIVNLVAAAHNFESWKHFEALLGGKDGQPCLIDIRKS